MNSLEIAKEVIQKNWKDGFTIPTSKLYPFQWMWDSGFVALATSTYNIDMAMKEIKSMFTGQWQNGMIPHIIFHSENENSYFPNFDFWNSAVNTGAPQSPKTSGITQPPVYGFVLKDILQRHWDNDNVRDFVKYMFPRVLKYHEFLYHYRDPFEEGLFYIYHPWESGRDNSPIWDEAMSNIIIAPGSIPEYIRRDTSIMELDQRPTKDKYDRYVFLLELGKKYNYDGHQIAEESPFLVQDNMMNALLIQSNQSLIEIAKDLDIDAQQLAEWQSLSMSNFNNKLWSNELGIYVGYDIRNNKQMTHREIGGYVPLFSGIPNNDKAIALNKDLMSISNRGFYLCPSFDVNSPLFDSKRYWRGPVWPQMNWLIYQGLKRYGFDETADIIRKDIITLIEKFGFYEYFEPQKKVALKLNKGYGGNHFSWTASSYIHLLMGNE